LSNLLADLIYIWAIQYFGDTRIVNRFDHMDHIFTIISELDPRFLDAYELGAIIAVYDARRMELAYRILDKGLEKNPDQWIFPLQAGHYAQMLMKDFDRARAFYKKAMSIPGAPAIAQRLYANSAFKTADYRTAWQNWLEIYQSTRDERVKRIASNHLYQVKAAIDAKTLSEAIQKFEDRFGRKPETLRRLVETGILSDLPRDLDGHDYVYDPQTGEVKTPSSPWNR
jgi:tetratricopeptide (TPR) repeat protein